MKEESNHTTNVMIKASGLIFDPILNKASFTRLISFFFVFLQPLIITLPTTYNID